eukprot:3029422-Prymnesium_polylepis.1
MVRNVVTSATSTCSSSASACLPRCRRASVARRGSSHQEKSYSVAGDARLKNSSERRSLESGAVSSDPPVSDVSAACAAPPPAE